MPDKLISQIKAGDIISPEVLKSAVVDMADENDRLREYAIEVTKALTNQTVGGSEFFKGQIRLGFFEADIPACIKNINWRMDQRLKLGEAKGRAALQENTETAMQDLADLGQEYDNG